MEQILVDLEIDFQVVDWVVGKGVVLLVDLEE